MDADILDKTGFESWSGITTTSAVPFLKRGGSRFFIACLRGRMLLCPPFHQWFTAGPSLTLSVSCFSFWSPLSTCKAMGSLPMSLPEASRMLRDSEEARGSRLEMQFFCTWSSQSRGRFCMPSRDLNFKRWDHANKEIKEEERG